MQHSEMFSTHSSSQFSAEQGINGFLKHRFDWNENVASTIAEREGLTLTEKHWDVIDFLRTEFYTNSGLVPMEHEIKRGMERKWNTSLSDDDLHHLFPGVASKQGAKIAGCITLKTVADLLAIKGNQVWSIDPDNAVIDAIRILAEKNIGALMVVKNNNLIGVVSERDVTRSVILQNRSVTETKVQAIMSTNVASVGPEDTLEQCMAIMTERGFRHLPVLDQDRLKGVLSMPDLVKIIVEQQQFKIIKLAGNAN